MESKSQPKVGLDKSKADGSKGFSLIELMVVLVIIVLGFTVMRVGFSIVFSRQLDSEVAKMEVWISAVAESAVFQSTVLGVRAEEASLSVVAFFENRWYQINGFESYEISPDYQWELETEERIQFGEYEDNEDREPFVAFLPSGQAIPSGTLTIYNSRAEAVALNWDEDANFEIQLSEPEE